jgi:hypothetical protein
MRVGKIDESMRDDNIRNIYAISQKMLEVSANIVIIIFTFFLCIIASEKRVLFSFILVGCILGIVAHVIVFSEAASLETRSARWINTYVMLWYYWVFYGFGYFIVSYTNSPGSAFMLFGTIPNKDANTIHSYVTILYLVASALTTTKRWWKFGEIKGIILMTACFFSTILPFRDNNIFTNLWKAVVRVMASSVLYFLISYQQNTHVMSYFAAEPGSNSSVVVTKRSANIRIIVSNLYILFGSFNMSAVFFMLQVLFISVDIIRGYIPNGVFKQIMKDKEHEQSKKSKKHTRSVDIVYTNDVSDSKAPSETNSNPSTTIKR